MHLVDCSTSPPLYPEKSAIFQGTLFSELKPHPLNPLSKNGEGEEILERGLCPLSILLPFPCKGACIISAVLKSFCHSHASGNLEIVPDYIKLDSRFHGNDDF